MFSWCEWGIRYFFRYARTLRRTGSYALTIDYYRLLLQWYQFESLQLYFRRFVLFVNFQNGRVAIINSFR